jgi:hypothetical protein
MVAILTDEGGKYPTELQANCCSLVAALGIHMQANMAGSPELQKISVAVAGPVAALAESTAVPEVLRRAARVARGTPHRVGILLACCMDLTFGAIMQTCGNPACDLPSDMVDDKPATYSILSFHH